MILESFEDKTWFRVNWSQNTLLNKKNYLFFAVILKEIINKDIKYIVEHIRFFRTDNGFQATLAGCPLGLGRDESEGPGQS